MRDRLNEQIEKMKSIILTEGVLNEGTNDVDFTKVTGMVIDKLEGGYYHPDMLRDGRVKSQLYGNSGETMFGIDRLRGGTINETSAGRKFWGIIDNANARKNWKWNYKGGNLGNELKNLVAEMMKPQYDLYSKKYLSDEARNIVNGSKALTFNFIYATWNGPGWFQKFGRKLNADVESGITRVPQLVKNVIAYRKDSGNQIIVNTGNKMDNILASIDGEDMSGASNSLASSSASQTTTPTTPSNGNAFLDFVAKLIGKA